VSEVNVVYLDGIYGIEWSPNGDYLYAAARGGVAEIVATPDGSLTNTVRCQAGFNAFSSPWDVAVVGADAGVQIVATDDDWQGPRNPRVRRVGLYQFSLPSGGCRRSGVFAEHPDASGLLFGIARAPDGTFWMTNYDRGLLYQLAADGTLLRRVQVGNQKVGVGLAILPWCWSHDGDVNSDGCIDDADLLAVLFHFGSTERGIREDTNCDGIVDDADLLTVLFNFGSGC
jgi:hypothetical protein